jgi:hypothetical protein
MGTTAESELEATTSFSTIRKAIRLYRTSFVAVTTAFLLPALGRYAWTLGQNTITHHRHPDWPLGGVILNADWGLNLYWSTIALSCVGLLVYFVLAGPSIAVAARLALKLEKGENGNGRTRSQVSFVRILSVQLLCAIRAWSFFFTGLLATIFVGSTFLAANPDRAILVWYVLVALTFLGGVPIGIWLTLRYSLVIPVAACEHLDLNLALARSAQLIRGNRTRLFLLLSLLLATRLALGLILQRGIEPSLLTNLGAGGLSSFLAAPLVPCILDLAFGLVWGTIIACLYAKRASAEMLFYAPIA